jgi:hypothetical protein
MNDVLGIDNDELPICSLATKFLLNAKFKTYIFQIPPYEKRADPSLMINVTFWRIWIFSKNRY